MTAILVPDAHARASIAAIRSLGRAGYAVHAASADPQALGLKSKFASARAIHPDYARPEFIDWLRDYVATHAIAMIVPTTGVLRALRPAFGEFSPLLPVRRDEDALYACFSKSDVVRRFMDADPALGLMDNHPASEIIDLPSGIDDFTLASERGYFIKAEGARTDTADTGAPDFAFAPDRDAALNALNEMAAGWTTALVQEACDGVQVGVSVLIHQGRALAVSTVRDCHPRPHSKGTMSLRESVWLPDVAEDTIRRLAHLGWEGCAMGEYRLDPKTGAFNLIEINFRYWQYLHLDLWAGMDYPRMQAEWLLTGRTDFPDRARAGVVCRDTWPGEVAHLVNEMRRDDTGVGGKAKAVWLFFARFFDPGIHQDFWFPGDHALYWRNFGGYLMDELEGLLSKIRGQE